MKASYTYLDHTADVLFEAYAPSIEELFVQCALAVENSQVDIKKVKAKVIEEFSLEHKDLSRLLFDFLTELLFYKDAKQLLFSTFSVKIVEKKDIYYLTCKAKGEKLDVERHDPKVDVKAITMHLFKLEQVKGGFQAKVLIDI